MAKQTKTARLKKALLKHAVEGKLVAQIPSEGRAAKLLESIQKEKQRLIAEGKLKPAKQLAAIKPEEIPFEIPKSWVWVRFEEIFTVEPVKKYQIQTSEYKTSGKYPVVDQGKRLICGFNDNKDKLFKNKACIVFGDHTRQIKFVDFDFIVGADGTKVLTTISLNVKYLYYALQALDLPSHGYRRHFSILKEKFIPLPPLKEQLRIVQKLESLLKKCQQLSSKLGK